MELFPAIDLKDGHCVRLTRGDFDTAIMYEADPVKMAERFVAAGASWLHIVDLDGARTGDMMQLATILKIVESVPLNIQVGGGIRSEKTIDRFLEAGVKRVVIGSLAVRNRKLTQTWVKAYGADHIVVAFDILYKDNEPEIQTQGWQSGSQQLLWDTLDAWDGSGLKHILCTDVSRDGMLEGTNNALYQELRERWPALQVLASGGVATMDDLLQLSRLGVAGAVVGKAIYEGRIDLADAILQVKHAG